MISDANGLGLRMTPESCPALVLNADYQPLSYFPLSVWPWQEVVKAVYMERVTILSEYDQEIRSPSFSMRLPSVVARSEEHTSELQSLMRISYAVFCLKKKKK